MANGDTSTRQSQFIRLIGSVLASLAAAFWSFVLITNLIVSIQKGQDPITFEGFLLGSLVIVNVIGTALAWWKPALAANLLLVGGLALSIFAIISAGRNHVIAMLISGAPFLLAGIFIWSATRTNSNRGERA